MRTVILSIVLLFSFSFLGNSRDSLFLKGLDKMLEADFQKAQSDFLNDALKNPSFSSFYNLGIASGSLQEWSKAKWAFESALKYKPLNGDAQYNAAFSTQKLSEDQVWSHPYPWMDRVLLGFGIDIWLIFVIITSVFLGLLVFNVTSKTKANAKSPLKKWCVRLMIPAILLFAISFYGIYTTNKHFTQERFAIIKSDKTKFYIAPNGVEIRDEVDLGSRLIILKFFKDKTWVQVKSQNNNLLWIKSEGLYTF
ncbi:MAG TPA: hypothetical protein VKY37_00315 [Brumimicrobium sp.]|nr:hypothetical protein [Brumimicrobium sp.]